MSDLDRDAKQAHAAREYVRIINATGQRFSTRETTLFCEAIESAAAPPVVVGPEPVVVIDAEPPPGIVAAHE